MNPHPVRLPVVDADDLHFIRLSTSQGLSQTRVAEIVQDNDGFIWFGTLYGLNRYDGYAFKVFAHEPDHANTLSGVHIESLFKDRSGFLWIGTDEALDRFDPKTETFTRYRLQAERDINVVHAAVEDINQDPDGAIWLSTRFGLVRLDPITGRMKVFRHDSSDPYSVGSSDVKSTYQDKQQRFWVSTSDGVDEWDRQSGRVTLHIPLHQPVRQCHVLEDKDGLIWVVYASGSGAGLAAFDPKANVVTDYVFSSEEVPGAAYTGTYAVTEDQEGNLWFGTGGMGLLRLDRERQTFVRYRNHPEDPESLADDHITTLFEDSQGNMWVGLHSRGPNVFAPRPSPFRRVIRSLGTHAGGEVLVSCIFKDHRGFLWIGASGGLLRLDPGSGATTFFRTAERGTSAGVLSIVEDPSGDLWLGTVGQGLKRFDPRTGRVKTYTHQDSDRGTLSDDLVTYLQFDGPGRIWVSTWNGLDQFDVATGRFTVYKPDPLRRTEPYGKFIQDARGDLWIAGRSGLTRFSPRDSQFTVVTHVDRAGSLSSSDVRDVFIDSRARMWVATENGLDSLNADGSFTAYREPDGLGGNAVSCILEDDVGNLWMSTNRGISRFDPKSRAFTNYSGADGVGDLTGWESCFRSPEGELFFGGYSGLVAFFPEKVVDTPSQAPVRLTDLRINGQTAQIGPGGPLTKSIVSTAEITLPNEQRSVSLEFASLNFLSASATRYRYEMGGLDSKWNEVGSDRRVVSYMSLPAGDYVFRAQAAFGRGSWTEPGVALRIHVLPPWWKSWWFMLLAGALLILLAWSAYLYRLRSITRQFHIRLEERVSERTRIARDLHDTLLQSFQGLLLRFQTVYELLPRRPADAKDTLASAIDRTAQAITEGREAVQGLRASTVESNDLAMAITSLGEALAGEAGNDSSTRLRVQVEGVARTLRPIIRDEIYRIASEALRNAFRHGEAKQIEVELRYDERRLRLRVRDDGKGIDPKFLTAEPVSGHYGLHGLRERTELAGGKLIVWSAPGSGTEIELTIPATRAYSRDAALRRAWFGESSAEKGSPDAS